MWSHLWSQKVWSHLNFPYQEVPPKKEEFVPINKKRDPRPVIKKKRGKQSKYQNPPQSTLQPRKVEEIISQVKEEEKREKERNGHFRSLEKNLHKNSFSQKTFFT